MNPPKMSVAVVPIGDVSEIAIKTIAAHIQGYLGLATDILPPLEHPSYALNHRRLQYNAAVIIKTLALRKFCDHDKVIGILNVDLFLPIFEHVFGEAVQDGKYALTSLYRLGRNPDGSTSSRPLVLERAAKVALHETGHLFNATHCMDERCLMHFSGKVIDLDKAPLSFCRYCSIYLRDSIGD